MSFMLNSYRLLPLRPARRHSRLRRERPFLSSESVTVRAICDLSSRSSQSGIPSPRHHRQAKSKQSPGGRGSSTEAPTTGADQNGTKATGPSSRTAERPVFSQGIPGRRTDEPRLDEQAQTGTMAGRRVHQLVRFHDATASGSTCGAEEIEQGYERHRRCA